MRKRQLTAGLRRFGGFVLGTAVAVAVGSIIAGLLFHSELRRAIALGFYVVGSLFIVVGFFYGVRPPVRMTGEGGATPGFLGSLASAGGSARWADRDDLEASLGASAVFVAIGLVLVVIGVAVDPRNRVL
jgi:hypothetical protein